jgi:N-methylhydantoinase A
MGCRLGIDVGGTSTDLLLLDDRSGAIRALKTPNSDDPADAVRRLLRDAGVEPGQVDTVRCAGPFARRAIRDGAAAKVGLLLTAGFEHLLHLARSRTPAPVGGWATMRTPAPLVDLTLTRGVPERVNARGEVVEALDETVAERAIRELVAAGCDTIAVCLMHSYANRTHERRLAALIEAVAPTVHVMLSADLLRERQEYERTVLTVVNAALAAPLAAHYDEIAGGLRALQLAAPLSIARNDGGGMTHDVASTHGAASLRAGPAGAAVAAALVAGLAGRRDAISLDMGGGGADLAAIRDGEPALAPSARVDGLTIAGATVDIHNAGTGGGAVARVGAGGVLSVGPAHATPACFGGGPGSTETRATVTDAALLLGRLPERLGDGRALDARAAEDALGSVARQLDCDLYQAAEAVTALAEETIAGAARLLAARRGMDGPAALVAFGGAGPAHGNQVAALTGLYPLVIPPLPGVMSPLGFVAAVPREDVVQSLLRPLDAGAVDELAGLAAKLVDLVRERVGADAEVGCLVNLRYRRADTVVSLPLDPDNVAVADLAQRFAGQHERRHGCRLDRPIEIAGLRAFGSAGSPTLKLPALARGGADPSRALAGQQRIYLDGAFVTGNVYARDRLAAGNRIEGPALITQADACTLLLPGHVAEVDDHGILIVEPARA